MPTTGNLDDLVNRAKEGTVTADEITAVASALAQEVNNRDAYRMVYILGRSGRREHELLLKKFLTFSAEPQVAGLALSILCVQWKLAPTYRDQLLQALRGYSWDIDDDARRPAISAAGEYLCEHPDCDVLRTLLDIAENDEGLIRRFSLESLSRALGDDFDVATMPRSRPAASDWSTKVIFRARARYDAECHGEDE